LVVQIIKTNKIRAKKQNQDGRQACSFHCSVNFYANQLKLGIWEERLIKKYCRSNFVSKLQNGGLNQDGISNCCFFILALTQSFLNRF
jgi:hypothetical protein